MHWKKKLIFSSLSTPVEGGFPAIVFRAGSNADGGIEQQGRNPSADTKHRERKSHLLDPGSACHREFASGNKIITLCKCLGSRRTGLCHCLKFKILVTLSQMPEMRRKSSAPLPTPPVPPTQVPGAGTTHWRCANRQRLRSGSALHSRK